MHKVPGMTGDAEEFGREGINRKKEGLLGAKMREGEGEMINKE